MEYINVPDFKGLAALSAIVEMGGVEQAGLFLNIGQPAITKRLRTLEAYYGLPLMQRKGRKLELTIAGEKVYTFAQLALDHQESLLHDLQSLSVGRNELRLETTFAIGETLLPQFLLQFNDAYAEYKIQSRMGYSRRIQTRLATGLSDLALIERAPDHPEILVQKWFEDEILLVCSPHHPLQRLKTISLEQLRQQSFVLRESQSSLRIILDRKLQNIGINSLPTAMEVGSTDTIIEMLGSGRYMSFLPQFAVKDALNKGQLIPIEVESLKLNMTLWIARNRSSVNHKVAEAFIQLIRKQPINR